MQVYTTLSAVLLLLCFPFDFYKLAVLPSHMTGVLENFHFSAYNTSCNVKKKDILMREALWKVIPAYSRLFQLIPGHSAFYYILLKMCYIKISQNYLEVLTFLIIPSFIHKDKKYLCCELLMMAEIKYFIHLYNDRSNIVQTLGFDPQTSYLLPFLEFLFLFWLKDCCSFLLQSIRNTKKQIKKCSFGKWGYCVAIVYGPMEH